MTYDPLRTIAAIATAPGGAARAVIRVSGPQALACAARIFEPSEPRDLFALRRAAVVSGTIKLPALASSLPCELYVWPSARSYTGQPSVELHTIGSPPLVDCLLEALCQAGTHLAAPGEFTLRAFLAGRLDLTQAEAVLGVIDAAGDAQLRGALDQLAGGLSRPLAGLRSRLLDVLAHLEAGLDFAEEKIEFIQDEELERELAAAAEQIDALLEQLDVRSHSADELRVVLIGLPNAGKSSLFNALAQEATALVSSVAGTTRDYLSARLDLGGLSCKLIDTAGHAPEEVDRLSAASTQMTAGAKSSADLLLLCIDASGPLVEWEAQQLAAAGANVMPMLTKSDLASPLASIEVPTALAVSARTGAGLAELRERLRERIAELSPNSALASTAARCRESLIRASQALAEARQTAAEGSGEELVAAELHLALDELGQVAGTVYTDDVLDRVFSRFCIGK